MGEDILQVVDDAAVRSTHQGCKIRSGRDRIIRIIAIGIWSEIIKILLAFLESKWKSTGKTRFYEKPPGAGKSENNMVHQRRSNRHATASLGCKSDVAVKGNPADDRVATTDSTKPQLANCVDSTGRNCKMKRMARHIYIQKCRTE